MRLACTGFDGRVVYGATFDFGYARWNTDHDPRLGDDCEAFVHPAYEVVQHQFSDIEIADDAVLQRTHRNDVRGRATDHPLGIGTDGQRPFGLRIDRHHRGLVDDNALPPYQYQRVGRAQVNTDVTGKQAHDTVEG